MSRAIFEAPTITPLLSLTGEMVAETLIFLPSLRTRTVSRCSTLSPRRIRARMSGSSLTHSGGNSISIGLPTASDDE
jgi:hypothetical protein